MPNRPYCGVVFMDMREFSANRDSCFGISARMLRRRVHRPQPDSKKIIAADDDPLHLVAAVKWAGYDPADCVLSSVPASEEVVLGGGLDE